MSNVLSGQEAQEILYAIDNEQVLSAELRERLTRLADRYEHKRIAAQIQNAGR